jgi:Tol biopolymer transport system component
MIPATDSRTAGERFGPRWRQNVEARDAALIGGTSMRTRHLGSTDWRPAVAASAAALGLAAILAGTAVATPPGVNGRIVFMRFDDAGGHWQTWTANPDLGHQHRITTGAYDNAFATWSPDGRRLVFESNRNDPDQVADPFINDVFTMDADGSHQVKLTDSVGFSGEPAWSPDGRLIVFSADRGIARQEIYVMDADGTGRRRVTTLVDPTGWQGSARFSPDGRKLVYTDIRNGGDKSALFTINLDGTGVLQVTPWGAGPGDADWSPDGRRLVFETLFQHPGNGPSVSVVDADSKHLKDLTHDGGLTGRGSDRAVRFEASFDPAWSPDGTKILFSHEHFDPTTGYACGLSIMAADGNANHRVSADDTCEHQVDWGTAPLE